MLTTNPNQYIRPEYLSPLPTTLDSKKSPLALLAQTCSQIGADTPNSKLIPPSENKSNKSKTEVREKSSPASSLSSNSANDLSIKSSFKPYEVNFREKSKSPEENRSSSTRVRTPKSSHTPLTNGRCESNQSASSPRNSPRSKTPSTNTEKNNNEIAKSTTISSPYTPTSDTLKMLNAESSFKPTYLNGFPPVPTHPIDLMATSLMSPALKNGLNPYLEYIRLKSASLCRDPYCTGCSLSSHMLNKTCPAGCAQCDHAKPNYLALSQTYAQLAAVSQLPYVCNWIAGDANYCGKRFSSSEELLQHLRTHTNLSDSSSALSMLTPPTHPLLHRTYPTPPLSPLAAARFHPYGKPGMLPPSLASSPLAAGFPLPHPSLSPYFSPYLYGPRLGASSTMHP